MKYWWLEKYRNLEIIKLPELTKEVNYFLIMPNNYEKKYNDIKNKMISELLEEEMLIILFVIVNKKIIKDNKLSSIIDELLKIKDNSFPISDYSLKEMLVEISNLKSNLPKSSKLNNNNIAICYNCLNVYYVDKIKSVNKNDLCLCPYCHSHKIYFDNDYIPMNYIFIKLANLFYHTSKLGCSFRNIQKLLKKGISIDTKGKGELDLSDTFNEQKIGPQLEKIIYSKVYNKLIRNEEELIEEVTINLPNLNPKERNHYLLILIISIMEVLSNCIYIKKIKIITSDDNKYDLEDLIKTLIDF